MEYQLERRKVSSHLMFDLETHLDCQRYHLELSYLSIGQQWVSTHPESPTRSWSISRRLVYFALKTTWQGWWRRTGDGSARYTTLRQSRTSCLMKPNSSLISSLVRPWMGPRLNRCGFASLPIYQGVVGLRLSATCRTYSMISKASSRSTLITHFW